MELLAGKKLGGEDVAIRGDLDADAGVGPITVDVFAVPLGSNPQNEEVCALLAGFGFHRGDVFTEFKKSILRGGLFGAPIESVVTDIFPVQAK